MKNTSNEKINKKESAKNTYQIIRIRKENKSQFAVRKGV
jgi:hypothetical protein